MEIYLRSGLLTHVFIIQDMTKTCGNIIRWVNQSTKYVGNAKKVKEKD